MHSTSILMIIIYIFCAVCPETIEMYNDSPSIKMAALATALHIGKKDLIPLLIPQKIYRLIKLVSD